MEKEKTWLAEEAKKHDKGKHLEREICGVQRKIKTNIAKGTTDPGVDCFDQ